MELEVKTIPPQQRYISNELTHFVGNRSVDDIELQYLKLCSILNTKRLTYDVENPRKSDQTFGIIINQGGKLSRNDMINPDMVCFCDIPVEDLEIHTQKYGYFGLSFRKEFIASRGGAPVFYIPQQTAEEFDKEIWPEIYPLKPPNKGDKARFFTLEKVLSYLKSFDYTLSEDDKKNYYFEREWRLLGSLTFILKEVRRVFLPEFYAERFRKDFPDYCGQVTFTKPLIQENPTMIYKRVSCNKCSRMENVLIPKDANVSIGIVLDNSGNNRGERICVNCGSREVNSLSKNSSKEI
jgi:hypothetical protein